MSARATPRIRRARAAARATARLLVVGALLLGQASVAAAERAGEGPAYRTVVVFGDTQNLVDATAPGDRLVRRLERMIDWVLANREAENVDFVLHVGDAIEHGNRLPLPDACLGQGGRCDATRRHGEGGHRPCLCEHLEHVDTEWRRFEAAWSRLDGVVPYAVVQGNHDNLGVVDANAALDRPGYRQRFGAARYRGIPGSGHLGSQAEGDTLSHVWRLPLGAREVFVVGFGDWPTQADLRWAEGIVAAELALPVIVVGHRFFNGVPYDENAPRRIWSEFVVPNAGRIPLAVWGHIAPGEIRRVAVGQHALLRVRANWQGQVGRRAHLSLLRFHQRDGRVNGIEVIAFDPVRGQPDRTPALRGRGWSEPRPFSLDP